LLPQNDRDGQPPCVISHMEIFYTFHFAAPVGLLSSQQKSISVKAPVQVLGLLVKVDEMLREMVSTKQHVGLQEATDDAAGKLRTDCWTKCWDALVCACLAHATTNIGTKQFDDALSKFYAKGPFSFVSGTTTPAAIIFLMCKDLLPSFCILTPRDMAETLEMVKKLVHDSNVNFLATPGRKRCLKVVLYDTFALYYMKRRKTATALNYATKVLRLLQTKHEKSREDKGLGNHAFDIANCNNRIGFLQSNQQDTVDAQDSFESALTILLREQEVTGKDSLQDDVRAQPAYSIDATEDNYRKETWCPPEIQLLISVSYHNLGVLYLRRGYTRRSCLYCQEARRRSRLCFAVSSPYVAIMEQTHEQAYAEYCRIQERQNV
jgi:hypothetical protein